MPATSTWRPLPFRNWRTSPTFTNSCTRALRRGRYRSGTGRARGGGYNARRERTGVLGSRRVSRGPAGPYLRSARARGRRNGLLVRSLDAAGRRPRTFARAAGRKGLRAGRRQLLAHRGDGASGGGNRAAAGADRPAVRGHGRLARRAPAEPLRADVAHEPALLHRRRAGRGDDLVVRGRVRPDAVLRVRGRRRALASR